MDILGRCNSPSDISGDDHDFEHTDMILIFDEGSDKNAECMKREDLIQMYDISEVKVWRSHPPIKLVKLPYLGVWVMGVNEMSGNRVVFTLEKAVPTEEMKVITRRILYNNHRDQGIPYEEAKIMSPQEEKEINGKIAIGSEFGVSRLHGVLEIIRRIVPADDSLDWVKDIEERSRSRIIGERKEAEFTPYVMGEEEKKRQEEMRLRRERQREMIPENERMVIVEETEVEDIPIPVIDPAVIRSYNNYEGEELPPIPEGVKKLSVVSCNFLRRLPPLPNSLEQLFCSECTSLTVLPALPQNLQRLFCTFCPIETLPDLPGSLDYLRCSTSSLRSLPQLPQSLTDLICSGCSLTEIPPLPPNLENLSCEDCKLLLELPPLPDSLVVLNCSYCTSLTAIPRLPQGLEILICVGCDAVRVWPELPPGAECQGCPN